MYSSPSTSITTDNNFLFAPRLIALTVPLAGAVGQLLGLPVINSSCIPLSSGAQEASFTQGGINRQHEGNSASDTSDFNDEYTGNLRLDYLLPSANITVRQCGVFWPAEDEAGNDLVRASDHRLVWLDITL